jgi:Protein of unknown function (DUF2793)/Chaperone of endosialidase
MDATPKLSLPYIMPSQAQKHVTHNEALAALDVVVQLVVLDRDLGTPPASPSEGDCYIVAASAAGVWAGQSGKIAHYNDGSWQFLSPVRGWVACCVDEAGLLYWTGTAWASFPLPPLQNLPLLGIGTTADATNPFFAEVNKALWKARRAADGGDGDIRVAMSKESTPDTASLLMQAGFSGRAELGLIGDNNLAAKVSTDGSTWRNGFVVEASTGKLTLPSNTGDKTRAQVQGRVLVTGGAFDPSDLSPAGTVIGYDTTNDYGFIGAIQAGIAYKTLCLQPTTSGVTTFGPPNATIVLQGSTNGLFHSSQPNDSRMDFVASSGNFGAIYTRNLALSAGKLLSLNRYGGGVAVNQTTLTAGFMMDVAGSIRCTSLTQTSDGNFKTVLGPSLGLDFIQKLNPVSYRWKPTPDRVELADDVEITIPGASPSRAHQGLIAQDVAAAAGELGIDFGGYKDTSQKDPDRPGEHLLDYSEFIAPLIRAVQELATRINALEQRLQ